ncbi:nuclease-related domain-containing protein [Pararoseomonas sp. SCSIO 73927]|uniref:nuclease-related domain-containing protein n=1 Tax=Pararoseomonas sp. SCSIO 73927 TaxID=3114537 RepID=UPI0030CC5580
MQRSDAAAQTERDVFLSDLRSYLADHHPAADLVILDQALRLLRVAEDGHHRILACLSRMPFSKNPPEIRAAAVVSRMEVNLAALMADLHAAVHATRGIMMPGGPVLQDATGRIFHADDVVTNMVVSLGGTLSMEGYANGWFDADGHLILPDLPLVDNNDIMLAGQSEALSASWIRWTRMHETARYGLTDIEVLEGGNLPSEAPPSIKLVYEREPSRDTLDYIANARTIDREAIAIAALHNTSDLSNVCKGIEGTIAAAPTEWISSEELTNSLSLSDTVGYEIVGDTERPGGLRLVQWVRGYACLASLASALTESTPPKLIRVPEETLTDILTRASLSSSEAATFLDAVSFGRSSRDLFDAPIVRTATDWLLIGPALSAPRMAKIVPSLLASRKVQLRRKGAAFEKRVLTFLKGKGFDARNIKVKRGGEEYDYDVVFPWGDHIFHFECKNHGLSGNDPIQAHHFFQEIVSDIKQVERLRNALAKWPDILIGTFGANAAGKEVIHCILENETYCIPGGIDGIYVYDWSALTRFFEDGWFRVSHTHQFPDNIRLQNRVSVAPIWSGDRPAPKDLIAQLEEPAQFRVVSHHLELEQVAFPLDEATMAVDTLLRRRPADVASMAEALGGSGQAVQDQLAKVDAQILKERKNIEEGIKNEPETPT